MSFKTGAWIRIECWVPAVSVTTVAIDRRVRCGVGSVCRLSEERTLKFRRAEGCGRVCNVSMRVADDGRNISLDDTQRKRSVTRSVTGDVL